ncbi:uncharacterized protein PRCAT00001722001 [Priceomyces carsonii]|uniref:uncharacterized protein n=1 Tax=Priceomyces carsonii TaxID=28549 RepID=UPI002ED80265|nr:unnamed protein product [Priceomyces carsonii]
MSDPILIRKYYKTKEEIRQIEFENDKRKSLIRLAVLKVLALSQKANHRTKSKLDIDEAESILYKKTAEYELRMNKLKQNFASKELLYNSKHEALRQEIKKLKQDIKSRPKSSIASLSNALQPDVSVPGFKTPNFTTNAIGMHLKPGDKEETKSFESPVMNSLMKTIFSTGKDDDILTPVRSSRKIVYPIHKKKEYTNYNTIRKRVESLQSVPSKENKENTPHTPDRREESIGTNQKPNSSFIANFENSPVSRSPSPEFSPTRTSKDVLQDIENSFKEQRSISGSFATEKDSFVSANSSFQTEVLNDKAKTKRKRKKLQLWKAETTHLSTGKQSDSTTNIEDEDMNSAKYYLDSNFNDKNSKDQ